MKPLINPLCLAFTLHLSGCSFGPDIFANGNPKVRQLQGDQTDSLVDEKTKKFLKKHVGDRVEEIWVKRDASLGASRDNLGLTGRAAAVSSDGYFLTAYHVVDDAPFYLFESIPTEQYRKDLEEAGKKGQPLIFSKEKSREYFMEVIKPGRIVWSDDQSDLALIKFDKATNDYFEEFSGSHDIGQIVAATDDTGTGSIPSGGSLDQVEGNWRYFAAGKIVGIEPIGPDTSQVVSTMIARKGMSGCAVVDLNGSLCGIATRMGGPNKKSRFTFSSSMTKGRLSALVRRKRQAP